MWLKYSQLAMTTEHYRMYPLDYIVESAVKAGFGNIELTLMPPHVWIDWKSVQNMEEVQQQMGTHSLHICAVRPEMGSRRYVPVSLDPGRAQRSLRYYEECCKFAQAMGTSVLSMAPIGPCLDENPEEVFERAVTQLKQISRMAAHYNVTIALESMPEYWLIAGNMHALKELIDAVGEDSLAVGLNIVTMSEAGETIDQWFDLFGEKIVHVRFSDGRTGEAYFACGEGIYPVERYLEQLGHRGYCGAIALPLTMNMNAIEDPAEADAKNHKAYRALRVWEEANK